MMSEIPDTRDKRQGDVECEPRLETRSETRSETRDNKRLSVD